MAKQQVKLAHSREPLQVPYPLNWSGQRTNPEEDEIFISTLPRDMMCDEIVLIEEYLKKLPYNQQLIKLGCIKIEEDDELLNLDATQLDVYEEKRGLSSSRIVSTGGERSILERVLTIREREVEMGLSSIVLEESEDNFLFA